LEETVAAGVESFVFTRLYEYDQCLWRRAGAPSGSSCCLGDRGDRSGPEEYLWGD
jgi:hypothetical protein